LQEELPSACTAALRFGNPYAGERVELYVSFVLKMALKGFDVVALTLPEFIGNSFSDFSNVSGVSGFKFRATWKASPEFSLTLMVAEAAFVAADELIQIVLPSSAGLALPRRGLASSSLGITFQAVTRKRQTAKVLITDVQSVGAFNSTPSLHFEPPHAGENVALTLSFQATTNLSVDDAVILWLPGFSGPPDPVLELETLVRETKDNTFSGQWSKTQSSVLLRVNEPIAAYQYVVLRIARSSGMFLPVYGISQQQQSLGISIEATSGPILRSALLVQSIGYFSLSEISYDPAFAGAVSEIIMRFVPQMLIVEKETVKFTLPGFSSDSGSLTFRSPDLVSTSFLLASWKQTGYAGILSLTAQNTMKPGILVQVVIRSTVGIRIPSRGLLRNDPSIMIESDSEDGFVHAMSVGTSPPVGALAWSLLTFFPACSGQVTEITFAFTLLMNIGPNAIITLNLPYFDGPRSIFFTIQSFPADSFTYARWNKAANGGILQFSRESHTIIQRQRNITIIIPAVAGLRIPVEGIVENQLDITMSISNNDFFGSITTTPVGISRRISNGTVFYDSSLFFNPGYSLLQSEITLQFRYSETLHPNDEIGVELPGFSGSDNDFVSSMTRPFQSQLPTIWTSSTSSLVLRLQVEVSENTLVLIRIPSLSGIVLPAQGMVQNQRDLTLKLRSSSCSVADFPVQGSPHVERKPKKYFLLNFMMCI
jgi:hypothetical protein